jgi:hypothetical protein
VGQAVAEVKIPYYTVRRNGRGFWEPKPHMRALGFFNVPCGPDGPDAWAIAEEWNRRWLAVRRGECLMFGLGLFFVKLSSCSPNSILVKDHTVIVPDLRGMGLSSHQDGGYEKTAQARDLAGILDKLGIQNVALVTHDIGNMVGYALAALYPARVTRWVVMDVPLPGIGHWDRQLKHPKAWHFNFRGPDVERLVAGRERASCLIAFTMNCPQPQPASTTRPATITPRCTPYRAPFTMRSADSMRLLPKTRSIIRNW